MKSLKGTAPKHSQLKAFTLVEVLVTLTVIGLMVAMVVGTFGYSHSQTVIDTRDQRNAQQVVNLCISAAANGAAVIEEGDLRSTIHNLMDGKTASHGPFAGQTFRLSRLSEEEIAGAMRYLGWSQNQPVYLYTAPPDQ